MSNLTSGEESKGREGSPFVGIGSTTPVPRKRVWLPPIGPKRGGEIHSLAGDGVAGFNSDEGGTKTLELNAYYNPSTVPAVRAKITHITEWTRGGLDVAPA
jgi:hypothetical protein